MKAKNEELFSKYPIAVKLLSDNKHLFEVLD